MLLAGMTIRLHRGDLPDLSRYTGAVAIDTETLGLNPFRDRLCLAQLSAGDGVCHAVQFTAGKYAAPIVVPPTVAILGAGRVHDAVVAHDGKPVVHAILPLSLTFDHRVVTGGEAARFLWAVIQDLELAN